MGVDYSIKDINELEEDFASRGRDGRVGSLILKFILLEMEKGPIESSNIAEPITNKFIQFYHLPSKDFVKDYVKKFIHCMYEASVTESVENSIPRTDCLDIVSAFRIHTGKF